MEAPSDLPLLQYSRHTRAGSRRLKEKRLDTASLSTEPLTLSSL